MAARERLGRAVEEARYRIGRATRVPGMVREAFGRKVEASILPPDPARLIAMGIMRIPPYVEHMLPVPPVIETIHSEIVEPIVESLPRLPLTSEPPSITWGVWVRE